MSEIIPGIFQVNSDDILKRIALVAPYVSTIQLDVADGTFVSAHTPTEFSFLSSYIQKHTLSHILFEAHLMVTKPELYIQSCIAGGFRRLIAHVECHSPREFLEEARTHECEVGLAIDYETPLEEIEPFLEELDTVLVLSAEAGASGQPFEEGALTKIRAIHRNFPHIPIEVDCGINPETAKLSFDAGATRLVSTSYIFKHENISSAIEELSHAAME